MEVVIDDANSQGIGIIHVDGRIDALNAGKFEEKILPLCQGEDKGFVLDFSKLVYISSAGLRAILKMAKQCKAVGKKIVICNLASEVREVFTISGFDLIIKISENTDSALSQISEE